MLEVSPGQEWMCSGDLPAEVCQAILHGLPQTPYANVAEDHHAVLVLLPCVTPYSVSWLSNLSKICGR